MMGFRTAGALAALVLAAGAASSAHATVYYFTVDGCTGGCGASPSTPVGNVDVEAGTGADAGLVEVTVTLTNGGAFHDTNDPQHHALAFSLAGSPSITISDLGAPFTANGVQAASTVSANGLGNFEYVVNFPKQKGTVPDITSFSFDIAGINVNDFVVNSHKLFFATDMWAGPGETGNTGGVGAPGGSPGVPEPATWALMLVGFGLAGTALRRRTAVALRA